jgi:hypothetical protein
MRFIIIVSRAQQHGMGKLRRLLTGGADRINGFA